MIPIARPAGLRQASLIRAGLLLGLATSTLVAQAAPKTIIPADPLVTLHIDGPAALRTAFLPTNLGKLFAGPEFKDMIAPFMQMIEGAKKQAGGQLPFDLDALEKAVYGYSGRLLVAFHLLDETIDFSKNEPPDFAITIALTPDGKTDLANMCKKLTALAKEKVGEALSEIEVGGKTITFANEDDADDPSVCAPFMHKEHAVVLIGPDMLKAAAALLDEDAKLHTPLPAFAKASIGASINLKRLVEILKAVAEEKGWAEWEQMGPAAMKALGLDSLESAETTYRAHGPAVLSEVVINFNQNDRGLLGVMFPQTAKPTPLWKTLPRNALVASAMPFDLKKLYTVAKTWFAGIGDKAPMSFEDIEEDFKEEFGLRLKEDLVDLFSGGIMNLQFAGDGEIGASPFAVVNGTAFGLGIHDGARFTKTIDTLLRKASLHAGRKKAEYKGYTVYNLNVMGMVDVNYVVSDGLFLLGLGDDGGKAIRAVLDEEKNLADGKEPAAMPKDIGNRLRMVQDGWTGVGWSDLAGQVETLADQLDLLAGLAPGLPPQFDMVSEILEKLPPLFKNYKVKYQVAVIRSSGDRWVYENIW